MKQNMKQTLVQTNDLLPRNKVFISVGDSQTIPAPSAGQQASKDVFLYSSIQAGGSAYGFELRLPGDAAPLTARSNQNITAMMINPKNNEKIGSIQLSEGQLFAR